MCLGYWVNRLLWPMRQRTPVGNTLPCCLWVIEYPAPLLVISKLRVRYPTLSFQTGKIRATAHTSTLKLQRIHNNLPHLKDKRPRLSQQTRNSRFKAVQPYCPCVLPAHTEPVQPTRTRHHHANQPKQTKKPGRHAGVKTHQRNQSLTLSRVTRTQQCRWRNPFAEPTKASTLLRSTKHHPKAKGCKTSKDSGSQPHYRSVKSSSYAMSHNVHCAMHFRGPGLQALSQACKCNTAYLAPNTVKACMCLSRAFPQPLSQSLRTMPRTTSLPNHAMQLHAPCVAYCVATCPAANQLQQHHAPCAMRVRLLT